MNSNFSQEEGRMNSKLLNSTWKLTLCHIFHVTERLEKCMHSRYFDSTLGLQTWVLDEITERDHQDMLLFGEEAISNLSRLRAACFSSRKVDRLYEKQSQTKQISLQEFANRLCQIIFVCSFKAVAVSVLQYSGTICILSKRLVKKLDGSKSTCCLTFWRNPTGSIQQNSSCTATYPNFANYPS